MRGRRETYRLAELLEGLKPGHFAQRVEEAALVDAAKGLVARERLLRFLLEAERVEVDEGRDNHGREELVDGHGNVGVGVAGVRGGARAYSSGNCWRQVAKWERMRSKRMCV